MISFLGCPAPYTPVPMIMLILLLMCMCVKFSVAKNLLLIKKVMSEELIYIVNGKKSNGNKRKNLLGKNERIGLRKKGTETRPV